MSLCVTPPPFGLSLWCQCMRMGMRENHLLCALGVPPRLWRHAALTCSHATASGTLPACFALPLKRTMI